MLFVFVFNIRTNRITGFCLYIVWLFSIIIYRAVRHRSSLDDAVVCVRACVSVVPFS